MTADDAPPDAPGPGGRTRVLLLLGDPVEHSLSPAFQNAAIRHAGFNAVYAALRCAAEEVAPLIRALCRSGGGGNVTVPHKAVAAASVDRPRDAVVRTGACNTFWGEAGAVCGDNTDVEGFRRAVEPLVGDLRGAAVLVLGAGGAAAAAVCALQDARAAAIEVRSRRPERARMLEERFSINRNQVRNPDLVVNATPLGLREGDPLPLDLERGGRPRAVFDMVYRPGGTAWVRQARALGIAAADGTGMLLAQGAAAFERWFGVRPDESVMRGALPGP